MRIVSLHFFNDIDKLALSLMKRVDVPPIFIHEFQRRGNMIVGNDTKHIIVKESECHLPCIPNGE